MGNAARDLFLLTIAFTLFGVPFVPTALAKPAPPAAPAEIPPPPLDLNQFSLRLSAMQTIYDLDLSAGQLASLRQLTAGTGQSKERHEARSTDPLNAAMKDLYQALATRDVEKIRDLRAKVDELNEDDAVDFDDAITATEAARGKAAAAVKLLKASQIAAYLADHADEVADPVEQMMATLIEITAPDAEDVDTEIADTAEQVSRLVAGSDSAKAKQVAEQIGAWLKVAKSVPPEDLAAKRDAFEATAKKIVGDLSPLQVLSNWLEGEMAELLSNPQLPSAIDTTLAGRKQ